MFDIFELISQILMGLWCPDTGFTIFILGIIAKSTFDNFLANSLYNKPIIINILTYLECNKEIDINFIFKTQAYGKNIYFEYDVGVNKWVPKIIYHMGYFNKVTINKYIQFDSINICHNEEFNIVYIYVPHSWYDDHISKNHYREYDIDDITSDQFASEIPGYMDQILRESWNNPHIAYEYITKDDVKLYYFRNRNRWWTISKNLKDIDGIHNDNDYEYWGCESYSTYDRIVHFKTYDLKKEI